MQKLDLIYQQPTGMNNFFEPISDGLIGPDKSITIVPDWNALVQPVEGLSGFDYSRPIPPILVNWQDGQLVILDGRKRFLACKASNRTIPYRRETFSSRRAKDEFLKHHVLLDKESE
jgi:hypothetical protein